MSALPIPWPHATATVRGAPPSTPIPLGGHTPGTYKILAVIAHGDGLVEGLDPAAFDASSVDGTIQTDLDTSDRKLLVVYAT